MVRLIVIALLLTACASFGPRIQGETDVVAWHATDLKLEQKNNGWWYTFELLIKETRGTPVTFTSIEANIYQPGLGSWSDRYQGVWRLDARDQFRIPLQSTITCNFGSAGTCLGTNVPRPLWQVIMSGTDARGQAVRTVIDITLPADPPSPPQTTSKSVRAITLTAPRR